MSAAPPHLAWSAARIGGATCIRTSVRMFDRALGPVADPAAIVAHYDGEPHAVAGDNPGLAEAGYVPGYAWMKFCRPADAAVTIPTTDLVVEQVGPAGGLHFARPIRTAFGLPEAVDAVLARLPGRSGWTCLVAYDEDEAVAAGALFVEGDEAWVGFGATLPPARGRGAQSAILAHRVALAAEQGATTVVAETGVREAGRPDASYRNILRAGFAEAFVRPNWDYA